MSNSIQQQITLLHEKMHVYQRLFPFETNKLYSELGFKPAIKLESIPMSRNNPDINDFVYEKDNKIFVQLYNSKNPDNISDSKPYLYNDKDIDNSVGISQKDLNISSIIKQYEHPNEIMATIIPEIIINNFNEDSEFLDKINIWMKKFL
jgi:hypothetical protein